MRCALSSPAGADLAVTNIILDAFGIDVVSTSDLGAGAALVEAQLDGLDFAIAVLPSDRDDRAAGMTAIYVEIGVLVGRGVPLLIITAPPKPLPPALATLNNVYTELDNADALRFHIEVFLRGIPHSGQQADVQRGKEVPIDIEKFRTYFETLRSYHQPDRGIRFEQGVGSLLRECGAVIEGRSSINDPVDIAAYVPGYEKSLGTFVVEAQSGVLRSEQYWGAQQQLAEYVIRSRSGLGLLIYESLTEAASNIHSMPLVIPVGIDELLSELELHPLGAVLLDARNRAIHRI